MANEERKVISTNGDLMNLLTKNAKAYAAAGIEESVRRNSHMNRASGFEFNIHVAEAVLVDFVNYVMAQQCCDLGLYTVDLHEDKG